MSNITYTYCIENLRYIHKIIGIDALIKEAMFIDHLSKYSKIEDNTIESDVIKHVTSNHAIDEPEIKHDIESDVDNEVINETKNVPENKNIVINTQKYSRTVLTDEYKCECIINNGKRCTLKKVNDSKYCSRHKVKMSKTL